MDEMDMDEVFGGGGSAADDDDDDDYDDDEFAAHAREALGGEPTDGQVAALKRAIQSCMGG